MTIHAGSFRVAEGESVDLDQRPTRIPDPYTSKQDYERLLAQRVDRMRELQPMLYADDRFALLLVFQAMDAAGKDGAIKHVMSGVNPQGVTVHSFRQPTHEELDHDFLWRTSVRLPGSSTTGVSTAARRSMPAAPSLS